MIAGLLAGLMACAQVEKPVDLDITESNPQRCADAFYVLENHIRIIEEYNEGRGLQMEVVSGEQAQIFMEAFNASPPASEFEADIVLLFSRPGTDLIGVSMVDAETKCVNAYGELDGERVHRWLRGEVIFEGWQPSSVYRGA